MVVSIEISGPFEEKLRRLVELGIYASAAEAVRDALRKLLKELDMVKIGLMLYTDRGASIAYLAEFAEEPYGNVIEYMMVNEVPPRLGLEEGEAVDVPNEGDTLYFDRSALYVAYTSLAGRALAGLQRDFLLAVPEPLTAYERVLYALSKKRGAGASLSFTRVKMRAVQPPQKVLLTQDEYMLIRHVARTGGVVVVDDAYTRNIARSEGARVTTTITLVRLLLEKGAITEEDYADIVFSLKSIPYMIPSELEEVGKR